MSINQVSTYLKYANVQMAAEALFDQRGQPPVQRSRGQFGPAS